jgi:hypothetical protein
MTGTPSGNRRTERPTDHERRCDWRKRHSASRYLHGICIEERALVAAGASVTRDVPAQKLAIGAPAKITDLSHKMVREVTKK